MNIKFRALQKNGKGFVYGHYIANNIDAPCIIDEDANQYEIIPDTVGLFTGIKDENEKESYNGDILPSDEDGENYVIEYNSNYGRFELNCFGRKMYHNEGGGEEFESEISRIDCNCLDVDCINGMSIIGNIHENPELLTQ